MATHSDRRDFRRQVFFSLGGIAIGLVVAGLIALFINHVIEPTMQVETHDLVKYEEGSFVLWYHVESPHADSRSGLFETLEATLSSVLDRLHVEREDISLPIDVLVHDSPAMMQRTTLNRKSGRAMYTFYSVIDLLIDEDPSQRLAELVLAFAWGNCSSQLLYKGMLMNVIHSDRDFHIPVAAAPVRLLNTFEDLLKLEGIGHFEETLYQRYQSPFSPRMAAGTLEGVSEFRSMFTDLDNETGEYDFAEFQAASLVQYLIDCSGGIDEFRRIWGPGTTQALITKLGCVPLEELDDQWLAEVAMRSGVSAIGEVDYYRTRFLFEAGEIDAAAEAARAWPSAALSDAERALAVRVLLATGLFDAAREMADSSETLIAWAELYEGWSEVGSGRFQVYAMETESVANILLTRIRDAFTFVSHELGFSDEELPDRIRIFYYESESDRERGEAALPATDIHRTIWHLSPEQDLVDVFVRTLPSFVVKKRTASNLLKTGLSVALQLTYDELVSRGCAILSSGQWSPLWRLGFGGTPQGLLETQTGLMMGYVVETYGVDVIRDLWYATARLGGSVSLDTALQQAVGMSRSTIEETLVNTVLVCD